MTFLRAVLLAALGVISTYAEPIPTYPANGPSYHVPYATPVNFSHLEALRVRASINGGPPVNFLVDTGSTGIVVTADDVPNIDPAAPAGTIRYSSSGVELSGVWTTVTIAFPDSRDGQGHIATARVPVLAVRSSKVTGDAVNAGSHKASSHPTTHMLGIGFGRGAVAEPHKNPFVNLQEMQAGTMRRGYLITRSGFELGLSARNVAPGYVFQKLTERPVSEATRRLSPRLKDWATPPGITKIGSLTSPLGTALIDTGLTNMMIANPLNPVRSEVPPGTEVTVELLGGQLHYSFAVGDVKNPLTPRRVTLIKPTHGAFVNTGLRALAAFDYLYDADEGYVGLRPVAP